MKNQNQPFKTTLIVLIFVIIRTSVLACDCISESQFFTENINKSPLVIHAKVIQQLNKQDGHFGDIDFTGITQLKVLHSFKGRIWTDTLIHINLPSNECGSSIQGLAVNQEVFLKASLTSDLTLVSSINNRKYLRLTSKIDSLILELGGKFQNIDSGYCNITTLTIINGKVDGLIYPSKQWKKYRRLQKSKPMEAKKYLEKYVNYENSFQIISVRKIYGIIRREIKGNR